MKSTSKNILIVNFGFPPNPGIGGRRWAKFSKYLLRDGINVHVVRSNATTNTTSEWLKDVEGISSIVVESNYPKVLRSNPKTFFQKVNYRVAKLRCKISVKGNYYDYSSFWRNNLIEVLNEQIFKHDIKNIVVSCAPFKTAYFVIAMKARYPQIRFIVDFRDPWLNNQTSYGLQSMSQKRIAYEKYMEEHVIRNYDKVIVVADEIADYFIKAYGFAEKINVVPNGFDKEDLNLSSTLSSKPTIDKRIQIVFAGTFYGKAEYILRVLTNALKTNSSLNDKFNFVFYGDMPQHCIELLKEVPDSFSYCGKVSLQSSYKAVSEADWTALFITDDLTYSLSTKFLEYLMMKKPILVFSKTGKTSSYIVENKMGFAINPESMERDLLSFLNGAPDFRMNNNLDAITERFDVKNLTKELESLLL